MSDTFLAGLFRGEIRADDILPWPEITAEQQELSDMLVDQIQRFADERLDGEAFDRAGAIPDEVVAEMCELGLMGLTIPEEYGGLGLGYTVYARILAVLSPACASTSTLMGAHQGIGLKAILLRGTEEQKQTWLPRLASGEILAAFALTEPGAGSDAKSIQSTADPVDGGGWVLNGEKLWITNGGRAGMFTVFANTPVPGDPDGKRRMSCFLVTRESEGLTIGAEEDKMGLKASSTTPLHFKDVFVPDDCVVGEIGQGFSLALEILNTGRQTLGAGCAGGCRALTNLSTAYAAERKQFGRPIGEFEMIEDLLADMAADTYALEAIVFLTTSIADAQDTHPVLEAAACKIHGTETLWRVANDALQIAGGTGFMREYPYERFVRDARINMIFEGTNQILRMMFALMGLKGPGEDLKEMVESLKSPAQWPGVLAEVASAKVSRSTGLGADKLTGAHKDLARETERFEAGVRDLAAAAEEALKEHRAEIRERERIQARLADMGIALYVMAAVISRATTTLNGDDAQARDRELPVAQLACARAWADFARARHRMESNHDDLHSAVAAQLRDDTRVGFPSP